MILTRADVNFWEERQVKPRWIQGVIDEINKDRVNIASTSVDDCINQRAQHGKRKLDTTPVQNMCNFARSHRRRNEDFLPFLDQLTKDPGTVIRPKTRSAIAKRWARRIRKNRRIAKLEKRAA